MANTNNTNILQQMYDRIIEKGGATGPITQSIVDAVESGKFKQPENKINVSFVGKTAPPKKNNSEGKTAPPEEKK